MNQLEVEFMITSVTIESTREVILKLLEITQKVFLIVADQHYVNVH